MPHDGDRRSAGAAGVDAEAESFAERLMVRRLGSSEASAGGVSEIRPIGVEVDGPGAIEMSALKPAEDGDGVVLRLVEKHGAGGRAFVTLPGFATAASVDLVERPAALAGFEWDAGARVATVPLRPFGIVSLRLRAEAGA